jgi:hypothetical protein
VSTPSILDVASGPSSVIGRYFSVLSVVPSALFAAYVYALIALDPWSGQPHWGQVVDGFSELGFGGVAALSLISLLIGLILQPLQYSLVQFCEGYWGTSRLAQASMNRRILHHRQARADLALLQGQELKLLADANQNPSDPNADWVDDQHLPNLTAYDEATRLLTRYPKNRNDVRPTRLGNVLRRYEAAAGAAYLLPGVTVTPHLALVAPTDDVAYLDDQRTQMDLAVRLAVLSAFATACTAFALWRSGLWLLLSLAPYAATYVFYRGAVGLAQGYGTALSILIDLNRFALYERLHMVAPLNMRAEREMNAALGKVLRDQEPQDLPLTTTVEADNERPAVGR